MKILGSQMTVDFTGMTLRQGLEYLNTKTGLLILPDPQSLKDANVDLDEQVNFKSSNKLSVRSILRKILADKGLSYTVNENGVDVVTVEKARNSTVVRVYPVGDLVTRSGRSSSTIRSPADWCGTSPAPACRRRMRSPGPRSRTCFAPRSIRATGTDRARHDRLQRNVRHPRHPRQAPRSSSWSPARSTADDAPHIAPGLPGTVALVARVDARTSVCVNLPPHLKTPAATRRSRASPGLSERNPACSIWRRCRRRSGRMASTAGSSTISAASTCWPAASSASGRADASRRWFYFIPAQASRESWSIASNRASLDHLPGKAQRLPALAGTRSRRAALVHGAEANRDGVRAAERQSLRLARRRRHHRTGASRSASRSCRPAT